MLRTSMTVMPHQPLQKHMHAMTLRDSVCYVNPRCLQHTTSSATYLALCAAAACLVFPFFQEAQLSSRCHASAVQPLAHVQAAAPEHAGHLKGAGIELEITTLRE